MSQDLETKNVEQDTIADEVPDTSTGEAPKKKKKHPIRNLLLFILIAGVLCVAYVNRSTPQSMAALLYREGVMAPIREEIANHFPGAQTRAHSINYSYERGYLVSHEESTSPDSELVRQGFLVGEPVYTLHMVFPVTVFITLPQVTTEAEISDEVTVTLIAAYQPASELATYEISQIEYPTYLYNLSDELIYADAPAFFDEPESEPFVATIYDATLSESYDGYPIIVISYDWTNTSGDSSAPVWNITPSAYQNGIGLEPVPMYSDGTYDSAMDGQKIRPDVTVDLKAAFYLSDEYSDVEFELTPWVTWEDNPPVVSQWFTLS